MDLLTPETLLALSSAFLAWIFEYLPKVKEAFDNLSSGAKRGVVALSLMFITLLIYAGGCLGVIPEVDCTQASFGILTRMYLSAIAINQGFFLMIKKS